MANNSNLVIIATRNRPHNAIRAFEQLKKVSVESDFLIVINEDQIDLYPEIEGIIREVAPSDYWDVAKGNHIVHKYWDSYVTFTGIDDDCMVTTQNWDSLLAEPIKKRGYGLAYGNDTIQGKNLPTKVMISTNIVKSIGYFAPPVIKHLYADNFWKELGTHLNALDYFPEVMMEHWHPINAKAPRDELYDMIYADGEMQSGKLAFDQYMRDCFSADVEKITKNLMI
jgi:hypothetical protein